MPLSTRPEPRLPWVSRRLEPTLRDDDHIARHHRYVGSDVTILKQIPQPHVVRLLTLIVPTDEDCSVSVGKFGEATNLDHDIKNSHFRPIWDRLRLGGFANHTHLLIEGTCEAAHHYRDDGVLDVAAQLFRNVLAKLRGRLTGSTHVVDQRRRNPSIGAH